MGRTLASRLINISELLETIHRSRFDTIHDSKTSNTGKIRRLGELLSELSDTERAEYRIAREGLRILGEYQV